MNIRRPLSRANILDKVNQYDIFNYYCTPFSELRKIFRSELRPDKNPTCSIMKSGDKLYYRDFTDSKKLDCFDYVQVKHGERSFIHAMERVNIDFGLDLMSKGLDVVGSKIAPVLSNFNIEDVEEFTTEIGVRIRKWDLRDKAFWADKYGLTSKELEFYNIHPLEGMFINNTYTQCQDIAYGYYFGKLPDGRAAWKLYQPYADKKRKWRGNCPESLLQGFKEMEKEGDVLLITKSLKDVVVLKKAGYPSFAPQAESVHISHEVMAELKESFKTILILYDNDVPGKNAAEAIAKDHNLPLFYFPSETKDASDFVEMYSYDELDLYLEQQVCRFTK